MRDNQHWITLIDSKKLPLSLHNLRLPRGTQNISLTKPAKKQLVSVLLTPVETTSIQTVKTEKDIEKFLPINTDCAWLR